MPSNKLIEHARLYNAAAKFAFSLRMHFFPVRARAGSRHADLPRGKDICFAQFEDVRTWFKL